jgi:N-acetylglucosaminyldiphosphoundecaprenol N-acetyl-beta-D-mannosaminyltransferase
MLAVPDVFSREVHCLLGLPFDAVDAAAAATAIREAAAHRRRCVFSTPNLNFLVACLRDEAFRDSVIESDLSLADGMPLVWVARMLGVPLSGRVAGSSVFELLRRDETGRMSVYFFGGPPGAAEAACRRLNADCGGLRCVGFESPGFGSVEDMSSDETIERVNASRADFVVVALGARKGQAWIVRNRERLSAPVISHLGAVLNFVAGAVRRAPQWMQRSGLEWVWRIREEPHLWRRYLTDGVVFLRLVATRVVPHRFLIWRHRRKGDARDAPRIDLSEEGDVSVVRLQGEWTAERLRPLRECFSRLADSQRDIRLEMERAAYVDTAFIGLLMLAYGDRRRRGRRLTVGSASEVSASILRYAGAGFLLDAR